MKMEIGITSIIKAICNRCLIDWWQARLFLEEWYSTSWFYPWRWNGNQYYYDQTGACSQPLLHYDGQNWRYFDAKGVIARGLVKIGDGQQFFDENGYQVKGKVVSAKDGKLRYFDKRIQEMLLSIVLLRGETQVNWYYFGADGVAVTGSSKDWSNKHFTLTKMASKSRVKSWHFQIRVSVTDANSGEMAVSKFAEGAKNEWHYFDKTGKAVIGLQRLANKQLYFDQDGKQVKGK